MNARVVLTMLSDWHIGTGAGRPGDVDAAVLTDPEGLPYIDAKSVHDMWRDACETAVSALDPTWADWVEWLFGTQPSQRRSTVPPRAGHIFVSSARLSDGIRESLVARPDLIAGLFSSRPSVSIDPATGTAEPKMLRITEMARGGLELHALIDWDQELPDAAGAVLQAGALLFRHVGRLRRRGAGQCRLSTDGLIDRSRAAEVLSAPAPSTPPIAFESVGAQDWSAVTNPRIRYRVDIELLEPVLVVDRVIGNQSISLDHLPGAALMPMLTQQYPGLDGQFAAGRARVLPAYPALDGRRTQPRPRCVATPKDGEGDTLVNLLHPVSSETGQFKRTRGGFVDVGEADEWTVVAAERNLQVFNSVDDELQRPLDDGVFAYETLAPGSKLAAVVEVDAASPLSVGLFEARIGRARRSRGRVSVKVDVIAPTPDEGVAGSEGSTSQFTLWLLSDTVVPGDSLLGSPTPHDLASLLGALLGCDVRVARAFADTQIRSSWQGRWQRPRPAQAVLEAGSVMQFVATPAVPFAKLRVLETIGIGERRSEGFGDVVIDAPILRAPTITERRPSNSAVRRTSPVELTDDENVLIGDLEATAIRRAIARRIDDILASGELDAVWSIRPTVSPSQLGTVRSQLLDADTAEGRERLLQWIGNARKNHGGRRFTEAELDDLGILASSPMLIWERLGLSGRLIRDPDDDDRGYALRLALSALTTMYQRQVEQGER